MTAALDPNLEAEALRALFDVLPVGIVLFETSSERLRCNTRAADLLGMDANGLKLPELAEKHRGWDVLASALASQRRVEQQQVELGHEARKLVVETFPLVNGGSVGVIHRAPRPGGDDVVAHLAHKLNNPLSTILMSAQLAADGTGATNPERLARLLGKIQDNARRCGKILEQAVNETVEPA